MSWHECACGLDVHRSSLVTCLLRGSPGGPTTRIERRFGTAFSDLNALKTWLQEEHCEVLGMEATGVFWKPLHRTLEGEMRVVVANPAHVKAILGHKTDRHDAGWLAGKIQEDGIPPSFIPAAEIREGRDLARLHGNLIRSKTQTKNQTLKLLSSIGIPLSSVLSDVFCQTGLGILKALSQGVTAWSSLETELRGKAKVKAERIRMALEMPLTESERWQLGFQLQRLASLEDQVHEADLRLKTWSDAFATERILLTTIPGIGELAAQLILAEIGIDLSSFPSARHFASWVGLSPANNETGGKVRPAGTRKGGKILRSILVECAQAAIRTRGCHLRIKYQALIHRMGSPKAKVAIAHKLALIIYCVLRDKTPYRESEADAQTSEARARKLRKAVRLIEQLGGKVVIPPNPSK
jgi:transposase